jgi:hypothetical protein
MPLASGFAQEKAYEKKDLRSEWLKYEHSAYSKIGEDYFPKSNTIYFSLEASQYATDRLKISSENPFFVFVNGKLLKEHQGELIWKLDSLFSVVYSTSLTFSIYQHDINERELKTVVLSAQPQQQKQVLSNELRADSFFKDFVIIAGLIVMMLFVLTIRGHSKLAADYFSVARIFSLREGDDTQLHARFTSSSNILFYVFCSLMLGLYLIIVFHHLPHKHALPLMFKAAGFWSVLGQWIKLSTIILAILFTKILIVFSLSNLFGMKGLAGVHFFNWMRLVMIVCGALFVVLFTYFISRGYSPAFYEVMLTFVVVVLIVWIIIAFFKLSSKIEHSMFHLFSYICATEIIPLLITIKVLFH